MNWVRINSNLPESPKMIKLARVMKCSRAEALGMALRWLCWLDTHTEDGKTGLLPDEVDESICQKNSGMRALELIGWATVAKDGTVHSVDYELYNGPTAKAKAMAAAKKAKQRNKGNTQNNEH